MERTVAEVAPAVRSNRDQLDLVRPAEAVPRQAGFLRTDPKQALSVSAFAHCPHTKCKQPLESALLSLQHRAVVVVLLQTSPCTSSRT